MLIIYVKHYLSKEGIVYFKFMWFPKVHKILKGQNGFISLTYKMNPQERDCVDLVLKFDDQKSLDEWIQTSIHDEVIQELFEYRSRDYWAAVKTTDESADPNRLQWLRYSLIWD